MDTLLIVSGYLLLLITVFGVSHLLVKPARMLLREPVEEV